MIGLRVVVVVMVVVRAVVGVGMAMRRTVIVAVIVRVVVAVFRFTLGMPVNGAICVPVRQPQIDAHSAMPPTTNRVSLGRVAVWLLGAVLQVP